jgi:RHS repeat-associated protein
VGATSPVLDKRLVHALGRLVLEIEEDPPYGEWKWHHHDHLMSTRLVTDWSGQAATAQRIDFTPFGAEMPDGDGACEEGRFARHERDRDTELTYMLARFESPWLARFLSADAAAASTAMPESWNRYVYAGNSPVRFVDPDGWLFYPASSGNEARTRRMASESVAFQAVFSLFDTKDAPHLDIQYDQPGPAVDGSEQSASTDFLVDLNTGELLVVVMTIDPALANTSGEEDVVIHEMGHVAQFFENSERLKRESEAPPGPGNLRDRPEEKRAERWKKKVQKQQKQLDKERARQEKQRKKQAERVLNHPLVLPTNGDEP